MAPKHRNKNNIWVGGITGFLVGIFGNLVAVWIQQDILNNSFTPLRVILIFLSSLIGILIVATLERNKASHHVKQTSDDESGNSYSRIRMFWSKLRTRGKEIKVEDISAIGSDIDIDTK